MGLLDLADVPPPKAAKSLKKTDTESVAGKVAEHQRLRSDQAAVVDTTCFGDCSTPVQECNLKCDDCKSRWHLTGNGLPDYMLVRFVASGVGLLCKSCAVKQWDPHKVAVFDAQIKEGKSREKNTVQPSSVAAPQSSKDPINGGVVPKKKYANDTGKIGAQMVSWAGGQHLD